MQRSSWKSVAWGVAVGSALVAGTSQAQVPEDDLNVVKRAVSVKQSPTSAEAPAKAAPARRGGKPEPQWLRVRVVEKGTKKGRVSVNLPLALVRALGDDWPIDLRCGRRDQEGKDEPEERSARCKIKIAEALQALEAGQDLVEIDDEESTVRIWVE